ncbi:MAG: hypothetical protein M5U34_02795 [Chloroflexi bacterium]|nr:hypothetical protein [Chloroflexota bacterium]
MQQTVAQVFETLPRIGGGMVLLREKGERPLKIVARSGYADHRLDNPIFECPYDRAYLLGQYVSETGHLAWCDGENIVDLGEASAILTRHLDTPLEIDIGGHTIGVPLLAQQRIMGGVVFSVKPHHRPLYAARPVAHHCHRRTVEHRHRKRQPLPASARTRDDAR